MPTTQGDIFIKVQSTEVNMVMKFIYKMLWTNNAICYVKCMASVHKTNHSVCESRKCFK